MTAGKKRICDALCQLADGKDVESVTISDIIAVAGINRSSFYYHFSSTREVLNFMMEDFLTVYFKAFSLPKGTTARQVAFGDSNPLKDAFRLLKDNYTDYIRLFVQPQNYVAFHTSFVKHFLEFVRNYTLVKEHGENPFEKVQRGVLYDYSVRIICERYFTDIAFWAERNFSETPEDFENLLTMHYNYRLFFSNL